MAVWIFVDFGAKIGPLVASGQLVPFELLAPLMEHEIKSCKSPSGWLLDGELFICTSLTVDN